MWIAVYAFVVPLFLAAFGLVVHNLPKVNATGSTMRLVSRITEMSNKYGSLLHKLQCRAQLLLPLLEILLIARWQHWKPDV